MNWHYSFNNETRGPVPEEKLKQMLASGWLTSDALVWRDGMPDWVPANSQSELAANPRFGNPIASSALSVEKVTCRECGAQVPTSDTVIFQGRPFCAICKPVVIQKMQEGAAFGEFSGGSVCVDGKFVVVKEGGTMPDRCFKCNGPATPKRLRKKLHWHHPAYYLIIPVGLLIYALVAMIVRRTAVVHISLCAQHHKRRVFQIMRGVAGFLSGILLLAVASAYNIAWPGVTGALLLTASMIYLIARQTVQPRRIDKEKSIWLKGAGKQFRDSLPAWR